MPKRGHIILCQYPECHMRGITEVGLTNCPIKGKFPKGGWVALCKKHRDIIEAIRIELWRKILWKPAERVNIYQETIHFAADYGISEAEVKDRYNPRFNMVYNGKEV